MERRARWALVATVVGLVSSIITIFAFVTGVGTWRSLFDPQSRDNTHSEPLEVTKTGTVTVSPVTDALGQLEVGRNVERLTQIFGPPVVTRAQPANPTRPELLYYRFSFRECDVQVLTTPGHSIAAFVVHGCGYSFAGSEWKLGETPFVYLGEPEARFVGGDAKFPSYVEKHSFGRSGHYHDFYFAGKWPSLPLDESSLLQINRTRLVVTAVGVINLMYPTQRVQRNGISIWQKWWAFM